MAKNNEYLAIYEDRNKEVVSTAYFDAPTIVKARAFAQSHKRHTPEIKKAKGVKVTVKRVKAEE